VSLPGAQHRFHVAHQLLQAHIAQADAEVARRNVFQLMGFVEDHRRRFRQYTRVRSRAGLLLDGQVGKKKMVVHDDHIAFERAPPHLGDEAPLVIRTALAQTCLRARIELGPHLARFGQRVDLCAVAGLRSFLPSRDLLELVNLFQAVQDGLVTQGIQLMPAKIIRPALHVADAQRAQQRLQKGHIAEKQLLL
jgi:hypothetical protein